MLSAYQFPPLKNWQDFENLCCDLWRQIWKDPNTQKNGRQGQPQHGIDVFGRPNQGSGWAGVQCKGKDTYTDKNVTEAELRKEVEKAKSFSPPLTEFTLATTGPRDSAIQQIARTISDDHRNQGLFSVQVRFWEDILTDLHSYPELVAKYYPDFAMTSTLNQGFDALSEAQRDLIKGQSDLAASLDTIRAMLMEHNRTNHEQLWKKYPFGYVLFGGQADTRVVLPFYRGEIYPDADWKDTEISLDIAKKTMRVAVCDPIWKEVSGSTVTPRIVIKGQAVSQPPEPYTLGQPVELGAVHIEGQPNMYLEVIDDDPRHPICVLGFKK